ncbi:hypothetical protein A3709_16765 [Halioglobus sp. HI00S01]|uniref:hypothetical protein n=1 Tax=Halioglobus sp. HI00S01 TaxID=1822214 RepID=UPI0007C2D5DE|nr:hypothetical protein [Halioglobus sp. HI00S01]KZX59194.1 hypothetical protein A3709_16765 [Halioglobus sp. HI00S01]
MRIIPFTVLALAVTGCAHDYQLNQGLVNGGMAVTDATEQGADYEVMFPAIWGSGVDARTPEGRVIVVGDLLEKTGKCASGHTILSERSERLTERDDRWYVLVDCVG